MRQVKKTIFVALLLAAPLLFLERANQEDKSKGEKNLIQVVQEQAIEMVSNGEHWPVQLKMNDKQLTVGYSFSEELTSEIIKTLRKYNTDSSTVVIVDMKTGEVLSAVSMEGSNKKINAFTPFTSREPAASLFKIVTASALLDSRKLSAGTPFYFRGKKTTLYKGQIFSDLHEGRTRTDLTRAFAQSNNPAFAKAALRLMTPTTLLLHAQKTFGFNEESWNLGLFPSAHASLPTNDYEFAELASGFNTTTTITPVQAALLAGVIANDGVMIPPRIVTYIKTDEDVVDVGEATRELSKQVLNPSSINSLRAMMKATLVMGTASKPFRRLLRKHSDKYHFGGKTGSITGQNPTGKREWFVGYMKGTEPNSSRYAVSVLNIYKKKWYIKASHLAAEIIENLVRHDKNRQSKIANY